MRYNTSPFAMSNMRDCCVQHDCFMAADFALRSCFAAVWFGLHPRQVLFCRWEGFLSER